MRLFVLGGTGKTGLSLIDQALAREHHVTAFARSPDKIQTRHERLKLVTGDPTKADALSAALPGHDAVLSAIGARDFGRTTVHTDCARATIAAMKTANMKRLVVVSSALQFDDVSLVGKILRATMLRNVRADHTTMEQLILASDLDYTIARPPRLVHKPPTGTYRSEVDRLPAGGSTLSFEDTGHFLMASAEQNSFVRKIVGICW